MRHDDSSKPADDCEYTRLSVSNCRIRRSRAGTEREPHRHFADAGGGAREQEIAEIRTGDEEDQSRRGKEHEQRFRKRAAQQPTRRSRASWTVRR